VKKLFFAIALVFILVSCQPDDNFNDKTVNNNSAYTIIFKYTDSPEYTLEPEQSVTWAGEKSGCLERYTPFKYVYYEFAGNGQSYGGGTGTFADRKSYTVRVNNTIGETVSLSEGFLDNNLTGIAPGNANDANHTGTIYTADPHFILQTSSGFPADFVCSFENNTFMITVRW